MPQSMVVEPASLECDNPMSVDNAESTPQSPAQIGCEDVIAAPTAKEASLLEAMKARARKLLACGSKPAY